MRSIAEAILTHAQNQPDKKAVILPDGEYTYGQMAHAAKQVAMWLKAHGAQKGDRIIVEASHTFTYVSLCYGIHLSRCVFVPLENDSPVERIRDVAAEVEASYIVTRNAMEGLCSIPADRLWQEAATMDVNDFCYDVPQNDDLVEILFTTGTTGKSKGVMVGCLNQVVMAKGGIEAIDLREDNVWMIPTPMNHAAGLRKMHMSMYRGSSVILLEGFRNMKLLFSTMSEKKATSLYLPPSAIHFLLTFAKKDIAVWNDSLRFIYSSSAAYPQKDKDAMKELLPNVRMYNVYGASEFGIVCALNFNSDQDIESSIGRPHSYAEILILDDNYQVMEHTDREHYGFVAIRSQSIMLGYWNEPELTASVKMGDLAITSDYGFKDENGNVILLGRSNDVINLGGLKVAPTEVEEAALAAEGVDECLLIPVGKDGMLSLKMLVVMKEGCQMKKDEIAAVLAKTLEPYKLPKSYKQIEKIERTFNGKIDRKKMIAMYQGK